MRYFLLCMLLLVGAAQAALDETDWLDLMPEADRQALLDMPEISHDTPEAESGFYAPEGGGLRTADKDLPDVMYSAQTVPELDGREILLAISRCLHPCATTAAEPNYSCTLLKRHSVGRYLRAALGGRHATS